MIGQFQELNLLEGHVPFFPTYVLLQGVVNYEIKTELREHVLSCAFIKGPLTPVPARRLDDVRKARS